MLLGRNLKQKERKKIVKNGVEVGEVEEKEDSLNINPLPKPGDIKGKYIEKKLKEIGIYFNLIR